MYNKGIKQHGLYQIPLSICTHNSNIKNEDEKYFHRIFSPNIYILHDTFLFIITLISTIKFESNKCY